MRKARWLLGLAMAAALLIFVVPTVQAAPAIPIPTIDAIRPAESPQESIQTMQLLLLLTLLTLAPSLLILTTSFTRIVIVLGFLRSALGSQQLPPNQVLMGLSLFLTFAIMSPTFSQINEVAVQPYLRGELQQTEAIDSASTPLKEFMLRQTREADLNLMLEITKKPAPDGPEDLSFFTIVPAFAISELKTAFTMGFLLFLPFVIIDMVTASTMMSLGMMMVPPMLVSLPFKILLFVLVDGWHLIVKSLYQSFQL